MYSPSGDVQDFDAYCTAMKVQREHSGEALGKLENVTR